MIRLGSLALAAGLIVMGLGLVGCKGDADASTPAATAGSTPPAGGPAGVKGPVSGGGATLRHPPGAPGPNDIVGGKAK